MKTGSILDRNKKGAKHSSGTRCCEKKWKCGAENTHLGRKLKGTESDGGYHGNLALRQEGRVNSRYPVGQKNSAVVAGKNAGGCFCSRKRLKEDCNQGL